MNNKISIAMATYNGEKYLREQLDSLYSQTLVPDEIIVVDDCSTDNTKDILEEYHQKYGLIYQINETNLGVNKNFERAISLCTGDYVALCDQDDVWMPHKVEKSFKKLKLIEGKEPSLVSSACIRVDASLNTLSEPTQTEDSDSYVTTLLGHHSQGCTMMMNRSLIKHIIPLPYDSITTFDIYIGLTAAMVGNKYFIAEPLIYYRSHSSNVCPRINMKKIPLQLRLKNRYTNRYPKLISEGRLHSLRVVANQQSKFFISERNSLFNKLLSLDSNINILWKINIILSIKELALEKRFSVIVNTLISHIVRKIVKS